MHYSDSSSPLEIPDNQHTEELKDGFQSFTHFGYYDLQGQHPLCLKMRREAQASAGPRELKHYIPFFFFHLTDM